jgi:serine/threonine protein kinase
MGTVRLASTKDNKYFVIKTINKGYIDKNRHQRHVRNEKLVLSTIDNNFCVKLFASFQDKNRIYFALEYVPGGELYERISTQKFFSIHIAKFYIAELFVALEHLHSLNIVYRDLKSQNILIDEDGHIKLTDFGLSTRLNTPDERMHTFCGSTAYLSPELLDGKLTRGYTKAIDWWAFGILFYELLTGKTPFCFNETDTEYEIYTRILHSRISFPFSFDVKSKDLITSLCNSRVEKRFDEAIEIKNHSVFNQLNWKDVEQRHLFPPFIPHLKNAGDTRFYSKYDGCDENCEETVLNKNMKFQNFFEF